MKKFIPSISEDILKALIKNHTYKELCETLNISTNLLCKHLNYYNIRKRDYKPICKLSAEAFYDLYIIKNLSRPEIAKLTGYTYDQICRCSYKYNIFKDAELKRECQRRIDSDPDFLLKREKSNELKYGVKYPMSLSEIKEKRADNNIKNMVLKMLCKLKQ